MNLSKLIPPWVFMSCIVANGLMFIGSILIGSTQMAMLNVLSGVSCYIGYYLSKRIDEQ